MESTQVPQSSQTPPPVAPIQNIVETKKKSNLLKYIIIFALFLLIILLIGAAYWGLVKNKDSANNDDTQANDTDTTQDSTTDESEEKISLTGPSVNKIFYVENSNIFSLNTETNAKIQLTSNVEDTSGTIDTVFSISGLSVIDQDTIGYSQCSTVTGDFGCAIYTIDLNTNSITQRLDFSNDENVSEVGFYSVDKFAYLTTTNTFWTLSAYEDGVETNLENIDITDVAYGRGGNQEDSSKISFSQDGLHMFHIATSSPRDVTDYATYIYDLTDDSKVVVENSTQPDWIDNSSIVYKKMNASNDGLYTYDFETATSAKLLGVSNSAYSPQKLKDTSLVLYTDYTNRQIRSYDLSTNEDSLVVSDATDALWISPEKFMYGVVSDCVEDSCMFSDFQTDTLNQRDINTDVSTVLDLDVNTTSNATTLYNK